MQLSSAQTIGAIMPVITMLSPKGGVGKTTTALIL
ncbi:MAG: ParA family protein, partial [Sphingomonas sp.]